MKKEVPTMLAWFFATMVIVMLLSSCSVQRQYHAPKQMRCVVGKVNLWQR
jgi:hypothetical protein